MKKIGKYLFAFLPFLMILSIFFLVGNGLYLLIILLFSMVYSGSAALTTSYNFFLNHQNAVSCITYTAALIPAFFWYYYKFFKKDPPLKMNRYLYPSSYGYSLLMAFGLCHGITLLFLTMDFLMPQAIENYNQLVEGSGMTQYSVTWFIATILLAPFVEELVFRGLTMRLFRRAGAPFFVANLLQAALFGLYHMNLVQGLYAFILGLFMGYLANHYHTLTISMAFHAFFNLMGTVGSSIESLFFNIYIEIIMMIVGLFLTFLAVVLVRRQAPRKRESLVLLQNPYEGVDRPFI